MLYDELVSLRQRGLRPKVTKALSLPNLMKIANAVCPDVSDDTDRLRETLRMAAGCLGGGDYTAAIADLWGIDDTFGLRSAKRRTQAIARLAESEETFDRYRKKPMVEGLATQLRLLRDEMEKSKSVPPPDDAGELETALESEVAPEPSSSAATDDGEAKRTRFHLSRPIVTVILGGCLVLIVGGIIIGLLNSGSSPNTSLPSGSVVNAMNGQVEDHVAIRGAPLGGPQIAGGPNFRACNLSASVTCAYSLHSNPIAAHAGDIIIFKLRVYNPMAEPLPYAKFYVVWGADSRHPSQLQVEMEIEWPYAHDAGVGRPGTIESVTLALPTATDSGDLVYVPGSTTLLDRTNRVVGSLPNGIMGHGIALTNIGAPPSCFSCDLTYTRYISFQARVR